MRASVVIKEAYVNEQHKEISQEFLRPTLQHAVENQNKMIGKKLKHMHKQQGLNQIK